MSRNGTRSPVKKRVIFPKDVNWLPFTLLQADIRWVGQVRLHQLRQDDECLLSEVEWPKRSGVFWYVCVSSGLLFDKHTGACRLNFQPFRSKSSIRSFVFICCRLRQNK